MKTSITFYGAAHEVTGSAHLIKHGDKQILLDCGMFQGGDFNEKNNAEDFGFDPKALSAVILSHAHIDHSGRVPKLIKDGYTGSVYATKGTTELVKFLWEDAERVMAYNNKKYRSPILFSQDDIKQSLLHCIGVDYEQKIDLHDGDFAILRDAGHIFGSAYIELHIGGKIIVHSGDIGNSNVPILKETANLQEVDILLCESTYGNRIHETVEERKDVILSLIKDGIKKGGTIMIPSFSIERTQELLYEFDELSEKDNTLPKVPIFLDSPLAIDVLPIYKKYPEYYDIEACKKYRKGNDFLHFPQLQITRSKEESMTINNIKGPKIIIAGSGMMNGGRIIHHLFRYLSDPKSTLIIVGYQAHGTLGRKIYNGDTFVKIFDQEVEVKCTVKAMGALSAHADQNKLISWISSATRRPSKVFCIHGEPDAALVLATRIKKDLNIEAYVPKKEETIEIE